MLEETLVRIAVALETIAAQGGIPAAAPAPAPAPAAPAPAPAPAAYAAPAAPPPGTLPPPVPPVATPSVQGVPTLDDIQAKANDFYRMHPERATEVMQILAGAGASKLSEIPPAQYPDVFQQLQALGA